MRKQIISELVARGYKAEEHTVIKNGVEKNGIRIMNDTNIAPVIYTDGLTGTVEEMADKVIAIYEHNKAPQIDIEQIIKPDFIMQNVFVGVQRLQSKADYIHRPTKHEDIEEYLYISINENMATKVTEQMLNKLQADTNTHITSDELFEVAERNTFAEYKLQSIEEALGLPPIGMLPIYVLTNSLKTLGASQLLNDKALTEFADNHGVDKVYIIPSSIHEVLLIADNRDTDIEMLSAMVKEVNSAEVIPEEQLGDNAIVWNR